MTHPHIILRIPRARLVEAEACEKGLALYDQIAALAAARGDKRAAKRLRITWTPLHSVWLAVVHPGHARWLEEQGMIPPLRGANLRGANLCGADLYSANLCGANLRSADLYGANLCGANLYSANLRSANLRSADLYGANLCGADLYGANLCGANLDGADLDGANLDGADLDGANLDGADLDGARRPTDPPAGWAPDASGYLRRAP